MTTETRIIVRPAPDALRAVGPTKPHAHAPTPTDMEEKPPAPVRKKHSGDPEAAKDASASKKPADTTATATMNETPASTKHAKAADVAKKLPASRKPKVAATKAKAKVKAKTPASPKPTRKTKKVAASSKPAPKKPAAKQIPKRKGPTKESQKALKLPPKRTDVLLPGPQEEVSSDSSDTDIPNPGPSPHPSLGVDYEESEPDMGHEVGEVERSPKKITDAQRVLHPGSPMSPKTVVAVERARLLEASMSRRDDPPAAVSEPQVIANAGVDEGVPPELLQPDNRQHLADRTHQEASQAVGTKRVARPTPLAPKVSYSRCDTGLGTNTVSTFVRVACLAHARRSATSVRSCSWWTPVSPANGMRLSSRGGWTTWAIPGPSS
ncbi:hypothetical protein PF004_g14073 [Phytophthora fragariae]|uniref:Uncharacterized protein n=1 Tax=Phytophthora fragariae TaxID=53985 RepID=A0A6A3JY33_9STRA|nr:hypothetical protein PF011_g15819 [Phytophthora fragariae]KAE9217723.1 hypothetical protein PF004_g14073 [Phytophthora fragariae]